MKKTAAIVLIATILGGLPLTARALEAPGEPYALLQLSLIKPVQLFPERYSIGGIRLNLIYGANEDVDGIDIGLINQANRDIHALELGLVNIVKRDTDGIQIGVINHTGRDLVNIQLGLYNYAKSMGCFQLGLFNQAHDVSGLQLGLINKTVIVESGAQIGLLNIATHEEHTFKVLPIIRWIW